MPLPDRRGLLVRDFLEKSLDRYAAKTSLVAGDTRLTFGDLDVMGNRLAHGLAALGVGPGDRVLIQLPNSIEAAVSVIAVSKASAIFSMIDETAKPPRLAYITADSEAAVLITDRLRAERLLRRTPRDRLPKLVVVDGNGWDREGATAVDFWTLLQAQDSDPPPRLATGDDLACLLYTSGTTGVPKGVMCGHDNVTFVADSIIDYLENDERDIIVNGLPLSFGYGLYQLLMAWRFGGTLVLQPSYAFPAETMRLIEAERATGLPGVPTFFALLLQLELEAWDLSSLRYLTSAAAAIPISHVEGLRGAFPHARFFSMYGQTECARGLYLPPDELDERPGSIGIPIPGTSAWLEDESGIRLGPGDEGQLVVQGRHVMRGYWRDPDLTDRRFRSHPDPDQRMLLTGDIMRMDEAGRFSFVARNDELIKCRGQKVYPREVESVIFELPGVVQAAVVGEPDPVLGNRVKAYIVSTSAEVDAAAVQRHCRSALEDYMVPSVVEFRTELPRTSSGKISKIGL